MKLAILIGAIVAFILAFALAVFGWYCTVGTLADMATTPLGQLPWVSPENDTQKLRTNMTLVMATATVVIGFALSWACEIIGKVAGNLHGRFA